MNIFVIDSDPVKSAMMLCDKHIVQMFNEALQMLGYGKKTHEHHPCSIWANSSEANRTWLIAHAQGLAAAYQLRYGKQRCEDQLKFLAVCAGPVTTKQFIAGLGDVPIVDWQSNKPDKFIVCEAVANCHPDSRDWKPGHKLFEADLAVQCFRHYYIATKAKFARWVYSPVPEWWPHAGVLPFGALVSVLTKPKHSLVLDGRYHFNGAEPTKLPSHGLPDVQFVKPKRAKRTKNTSPASAKTLEGFTEEQLAEANAQRDRIKEALNGKNVPTIKRILGWLQDGSLEACVSGHIAYWSK